MKPGQIFDCPHCKQNSFLKKEAVLDGWVKKGDVLKCASCGTVIEELHPENAGSETAGQPDPEKKQALAALLGGEEDLSVGQEDLLKEEKRFCRDCVHRVAAAYRMRCAKYDKDVNPMDDCPDYSPRKS